MKPEKRRTSPVMLAGLGGFALGAATVLFVVWAAQGALTSWYPPAAPPAQEVAAPLAPSRLPATPSAAPTPGTPPPEPSSPPTAPAAPPPADAAAPPAVISGASPEVTDLRQRRLLMPVQGVRREQLVDSFADGRVGHLHEAIDIMAARNTPILAVEDGKLAKLFFSQRGGNTIYQFDPSATYAYYYAHLERYADGLHEGDLLRRGQVIGYVGTSGDAPPNAPHLHFAIFLLTAEKHWWQGTAINPFPVFR